MQRKKKRVLEREKERERKDLKVANFRLNDMRSDGNFSPMSESTYDVYFYLLMKSRYYS